MKNITKEVAISYLKWNLYIVSAIQSNLTNSKDLIKITLAIGIAISTIMFSNNPNKREAILSAYQKIISAFLLKNKHNAVDLISLYNEFTLSLKPLTSTLNKDKTIEETELDQILQNIAKQSNYQA